MKKLITLASIGLSVGFAIALANAEDSTMTRDTGTFQQPGMTGTTPDTSGACTDQKGVTYQKDQKGYSECIQSSDKTKKSEHTMGQPGSSPRPSTEE